jgi:hypothetical protein
MAPGDFGFENLKLETAGTLTRVAVVLAPYPWCAWAVMILLPLLGFYHRARTLPLCQVPLALISTFLLWIIVNLVEWRWIPQLPEPRLETTRMAMSCVWILVVLLFCMTQPSRKDQDHGD